MFRFNRIFRISLSIAVIAMGVLVVAPSVVLADETSTTMSIYPSSGPVGTKVYVTLTSFKPSETVEICFNDISSVVQTRASDQDGYLYTAFVVGKCPAGRHKVLANDGTNEKYAYFIIEQEINLAKTTGYAGDKITVKGTGFAADKAITIHLGGKKIGTSKTNKDGTFSTACTVPESCKGRHTIKAEDTDDNYDTIDFITRQSISINPTSGIVSSKVTISGRGFRANGDVVTTFDDEEVASNPTDANGSFSGVFIVPSRINGGYKIKASDGTNLDYADFTISTGVNLSRDSGHVGTTVVVSGTGFVANDEVIIKYEGTKIATTTADGIGGFSVNFKVPRSKHGKHTIVAADSVNTMEMTFTMESDAPSSPALLLPADKCEAAAQAHFNWEDVSDPSGVTYTLQVATNADFTDVVSSKKGLTKSEYATALKEKLEPTKKEVSYYWRVKAVDNASNESEWSTTRAFYVNRHVGAMPAWTKYSLIGLCGMLVVSLLYFYLWKRRSINNVAQ
jgi:hypothetical protein